MARSSEECRHLTAVGPLLLLLLSVGCESTVEVQTRQFPSFIVDGAEEDGFAAVGGLVTQFPGEAPSASFCSGTLIAPTWVLTAAHCLENLSNRVPERLQPSDADYLHFFVGPDTQNRADSDRVVPAKRSIIHPGYFEPGGDRPHDIALFELESPIVGVAPIPIRRALLDGAEGSTLTYVGYGVSSGNGGGGGRKRRSVERIEQVLPTVYVTAQLGGGVCFGDSGGPGLLEYEGLLQVAGVNSTVFGSPVCEEYSTQIRVDAHRSWIDSVMGQAFSSCLMASTCQCPEACQPDGTCDHALCGQDACDDIGPCIGNCRTSTCYFSCLLTATSEARYLYEELSLCASERCQGQGNRCLEEQCRRELYGCERGLDAVTGSEDCGQIFRCEEECSLFDLNCFDACYYRASLPAQKERQALQACQDAACEEDGGDDCIASRCRSEVLTCLPDQNCSLLGGGCEAGFGCRAEAWAGRYCLPGAGIQVGDACPSSRQCADGAFCYEGVCMEACTDARDCAQSHPPCMLAEVPDQAVSIGLCSLNCMDDDDDGACNEVDCDPWNSDRRPGAEEVCDDLGVDEDCDGERNEGCPSEAGLEIVPPPSEETSGCRCSSGAQGSWVVVWIGLFLIRLRRRWGLILFSLMFAAGCGDDSEPLQTVGSVESPDGGGFGPLDPPKAPPPGIYELQQGLVESGTQVILQGVVSASFGQDFFLSEPRTRAYGGIFVQGASLTSAAPMGAEVEVEGRYIEQSMVDTSSLAINTRSTLVASRVVTLDTGPFETEPLKVSAAELAISELAEPYEGVLVELDGAILTGWDGGLAQLDSLVKAELDFGFDETYIAVGLNLARISGVLHVDERGFFLWSRSAADVVRAPPRADGCFPVAESHVLCRESASWDDARVQCALRGGRLVILEDEEENASVSEAVGELSNQSYWIAATDRVDEGVFLWVDGSTIAYDAWAGGEPNNSGGSEDCAQGNFRRPGLWNDGRCSSRHEFVCEFDREPPLCQADPECGQAARCVEGRCRGT